MDTKHKYLIDDLVECYRAKRKAYIKKEWLTFSSFLGRVKGNSPTYDRLLDTNIIFFESASRIVRTHLDSNGMSSSEINDMVLFLKNHRSILGERDSFLVFYAALIGVMLLIPKTDWKSWIMVMIAVLFSIIALFERWNMKQYDALYNELIEILQNEVKKRG